MAVTNITVNGTRLIVSEMGKGSPLLCLHGWGASHESFGGIGSALSGNAIRIISPDLPGFGCSTQPPQPWSVDDYADCVDKLANELQLARVALLGHSFGGRVAIKLASRGCAWIDHLYLCASAGIRHSRHWKRAAGIVLAGAGNAIFSLPIVRMGKPAARKILYKALGVHDYEHLSGVMRETMIKVINEDLTPLLEKITAPTDIFWGADDGVTPLADGELMNKKIVQSVLHTFPGVRHGVHRDRAMEIAQVINKNITTG